ncbi:MAG: hypothetical protein V4516_04210, partial [Pseudomonadota bacterium]
MTLNLMMTTDREELKPRITVFGVGGAGGNAVNNMIDKQLEGVEFVVANTDAQALQQSRAAARIQMGVKVTEGLGAGARPTVGAAAAEETIEEIVDHLAGAHMCFITAGMGEIPAGDYALPFQMVSCILLQPGATVSHDALRLLALYAHLRQARVV